MLQGGWEDEEGIEEKTWRIEIPNCGYERVFVQFPFEPQNDGMLCLICVQMCVKNTDFKKENACEMRRYKCTCMLNTSNCWTQKTTSDWVMRKIRNCCLSVSIVRRNVLMDKTEGRKTKAVMDGGHQEMDKTDVRGGSQQPITRRYPTNVSLGSIIIKLSNFLLHNCHNKQNPHFQCEIKAWYKAK